MGEMTINDVITTFPLTDIHAPYTETLATWTTPSSSRFFAQIRVSDCSWAISRAKLGRISAVLLGFG